MTESTLIKGETNTNVFVDTWDEGGIWLSIQTPHGGAHCVINEENARAMMEAIKAALGKTQ